jgi:hypothetical protein
MSKTSRRSFTCSCGRTFEADVFRSANVTLQPGLKAQILAGHFNRVRCPSCRTEIDAGVPFLYHDMAANLMVWVYPSASAGDAAVIRAKVRRSHEIVGSVLPHEAPDAGHEVVFGLEELLPLIGVDGAAP